MARLIVVAESEDTIAAPFNREPNYIVVSVTDLAGNPIRGLRGGNFRVEAEVVAPYGSLVRIARVMNGRLPGVYHIHIVPVRRYTWTKGVYIFSIQVVRGSGRQKDGGQTLASVMMD